MKLQFRLIRIYRPHSGTYCPPPSQLSPLRMMIEPVALKHWHTHPKLHGTTSKQTLFLMVKRCNIPGYFDSHFIILVQFMKPVWCQHYLMTRLAGWRNQKSLIPGSEKGFISFKQVQTGLRPSHFAFQCIKETVNLHVKQPEHAVCHAPPCITEAIRKRN
jgi:hypothetical protein